MPHYRGRYVSVSKLSAGSLYTKSKKQLQALKKRQEKYADELDKSMDGWDKVTQPEYQNQRISAMRVLQKDRDRIEENIRSINAFLVNANPGTKRMTKKIVGVALNPSGKFLGFIDESGSIRKGRVRRLRNPQYRMSYKINSGPWKKFSGNISAATPGEAGRELLRYLRGHWQYQYSKIKVKVHK